MRILIYKRTHTGDPDLKGRFGIHDCMGRVRDYDYDAVIGVGGIVSAEHARATLLAGANLIQIYTGFAYRGSALLEEIVDALPT